MKAWLPLDHDCGPNNGLRSMPHKRANRRARCVGACSVPARSHPAHKAAFDASRREREDEAKAEPPAPSGSLTITLSLVSARRLGGHARVCAKMRKMVHLWTQRPTEKPSIDLGRCTSRLGSSKSSSPAPAISRFWRIVSLSVDFSPSTPSSGLLAPAHDWAIARAS